MWRKLEHTLSPLTKICSTKVKFKCNGVEHNAFIEMNKIVGRDLILSYPNFIEVFIIHIYSRKTHIEGVIS